MSAEPPYGTVMIGRSSASVEQLRTIVGAWAAQIGTAAGFVDERWLVADDGRVVTCVRFVDRAAYESLSDNPAQAAWWESELRPLLGRRPRVDRRRLARPLTRAAIGPGSTSASPAR